MTDSPPSYHNQTALFSAHGPASSVSADALPSVTGGASNSNSSSNSNVHNGSDSAPPTSNAAPPADAVLEHVTTRIWPTTANVAVPVPDFPRGVSAATGTQTAAWSAHVGNAQGFGLDLITPLAAAVAAAHSAEAVPMTLAAVAAQQQPSDVRGESSSSLSSSLSSPHHSSMSRSPTILYQPVLSSLGSDGSQRVTGDAHPCCSVSSLSANGSATLAALATKNASTPTARSLEMLHAARVAGNAVPPRSETGSTSSLTGGPPSPAHPRTQPQSSDRHALLCTPLSPHPISSRSSSHKHLLQQQQQQGAADLLAELNPSLLFMVQALRHCRLSEVMCPVVVIGNTRAHAAAAWTALAASWGNHSSSSSASSPGLTAAPTNTSSSACEPAPGVLHAMTSHTLAAVLDRTNVNSSHNNPDNNNHSTNSNNISSNFATLPVSVASDRSGSPHTHSGALLGSITEYDGVDIDDDQARARGVGKERQRDATLMAGDFGVMSTLGSKPPPSVANTEMGHRSPITPVLDSVAAEVNSNAFMPSLTHFSESAAQLINPWPLLYANDTALGLLGYHKLEDVVSREFDDIFRCFVYTPDNSALRQQQQQPRKPDCPLSNEGVDTNSSNASDPEVAAPTTTTAASRSRRTTAAKATTAPTTAQRPLTDQAALSTPLDELLRHTDRPRVTLEGKPKDVTAAAEAAGKEPSTNSAATFPHPSKLREVHNFDELFAPRYDSYVFLYAERTASYYAALAVSSDQVELSATTTTTTKEANAGPAALAAQHNPYLRLFDSLTKWKNPSHPAPHPTAAALAPSTPPPFAVVAALAQQPSGPSVKDTRSFSKAATVTDPANKADQQQQQHPKVSNDLRTFAFSVKPEVKPPHPTVAERASAPLAHHQLPARYLVLYLLQRVETGLKPQVLTRPPVPKPDVGEETKEEELAKTQTATRDSSARTGSLPRRVTGIYTLPPHHTSMDAAPTAVAARSSPSPPRHRSSSAPLLGEKLHDDVDAPVPTWRRTSRHMRQRRTFRHSDSDVSTTKLLHGGDTVENTPLLELQNCSPRSSTDWSASSANDSNTIRSDAARAAHTAAAKDGGQQSSLFELSYTSFQADLAKPARTSSDFVPEALNAATGAAATAATSTPTFGSRTSPMSAVQSTPALRQRQQSPTLRAFSAGDMTEHSALALRSRLGHMSSSHPLAPSANPFYAGLTPPSSAGSVPLSVHPASLPNSAGSLNLPHSNQTSPSEHSHSLRSGQLMLTMTTTTTTTTAQPFLATKPVGAPWRSIQEVRNVEGVAQLAQQVREAIQQRSYECNSTGTSSGSAASPVASVNSSSPQRQHLQRQQQQHTTSMIHYLGTPGTRSAQWQRRGSRGLMAGSAPTTATEAPASLPHSTNAGSNSGVMRHLLAPNRVTYSADWGSGRSTSQLLGSTAAMTWQRSNEVDQIEARKLANRIRSQRNVMRVVTSTRLPGTLIFNSVALMMFVQQVLRFQQSQGVLQVACILNVRAKTQLVVDMIPVDRLDDASHDDVRSFEVSSMPTTPSIAGATPAARAARLSTPTSAKSVSTAGVTWARTQPSGEHLTALLKRRLAKMDTFYSEEESRQTYPTFSESTPSVQGSGSNSISISAHLNELHEHDMAMSSRTALRAGSFVMSRLVDPPFKRESSTFNMSESRGSGEASASPAASAATVPRGTGTGNAKTSPSAAKELAPPSTPPVGLVVDINAFRRSSSSSQTGERWHSPRRDTRRSHSHEYRTERGSSRVFMMEGGRQVGASAPWTIPPQEPTEPTTPLPLTGGRPAKSAMELIGEAAARVMGSSRNVSRSNSFARSGTHTPTSGRARSLPSHPTIIHSSDINTSTVTTTATASIADANDATGAATEAALMDSLTPPSHELDEGSPTTHKSSSTPNDSSSRTRSSKSASSWSAQWAGTQHPQPDSPPAQTTSPLPQHSHSFPPREWVPKSDYLSADTQQDLAMCDGDINVSVLTHEAQVCIPFITPYRLELLSQLGNVQLSSYRGVSVFGVNLVNMVTEEAAAAAEQPSPPIIPLQYDLAAGNYMKAAGEKSTVLPPFNGDDAAAAAAVDTPTPSAHQRKKKELARTASGHRSEEHGTAAQTKQKKQERTAATNLSPVSLSPPESDAEVPASSAPSSRENGAVLGKTVVSAIVPSSSQPIRTRPSTIAMEYTPEMEDLGGKAGDTSLRTASSHKSSSGAIPDSNAASCVSMFTPDHQPHQSPIREATGEEPQSPRHPQPSAQLLQQQQQPQGPSTARSTVIEKGSVVSVVMPPREARRVPTALADKQKRRPLLPTTAAADASRKEEVPNHKAAEDAAAAANRSDKSDDDVAPVEDGIAVGETDTAAAAALPMLTGTTTTKSPHASINASTTCSGGVTKTKPTNATLSTFLKEPSMAAAAVAAAPAAVVVAAAAPVPDQSDSPITDWSSKIQHTTHEPQQQQRQQKMKVAAEKGGVDLAHRTQAVSASPLMDREQDAIDAASNQLRPSSRTTTAVDRGRSEQAARISFLPEGLPHDGDWLVQSNEQSTTLTLVAPGKPPAASLSAYSASERSERSASAPQHLSASPPPLLPHPVSICERQTNPANAHVDPCASPTSTTSNTQGMVSVRTQKSGGTELLGYTLSNSAAAALGGFSTALMKEVTLDSDNKSSARGSRKEEGGADVNSTDHAQAGLTPTAAVGDGSSLNSPSARRTNPLEPEPDDAAPRLVQTTAAAIAAAPAIPAQASDLSTSHSPRSTSPKSTANTVTAAFAAPVDDSFASVNILLTAATTPVNEVTGPMPSRPSAMAAAAGRHGSLSGVGSNVISFPASASTSFEDTRQVPAVTGDEANDSFAESFMDIFGLASHPQRLADLRRHVADRMRDARAKAPPGIESSASSPPFAHASPRRSFTTTLAANASSLPHRAEAGSATSSSNHNNNNNSSAFQSYFADSAAATTDSNAGHGSEKLTTLVPNVGGGGDTSSRSFHHRHSSRSPSVNETQDSEWSRRKDEEFLKDSQKVLRTAEAEAAEQLMRHNLHILVYTSRMYPEMEEVLGLYGHCTTFVTSPLKMLRYARAGLQPFDVLIVEWVDYLVTAEIHDMLAHHAVDKTVVVYFISIKPGVQTPTMNVENVMTDTTVVVHAEDLLTGLLTRNVLGEVQQLIRRRRLLLSMMEVHMHQTYQIVSHIGSGAFGDVFEVLMYVSQGKLAMKRIFLKSMKLRQLELINREVNILRALDHPNIVSLSHTQLEDNAYSIFMELCDSNLADHLLEPSTAIPGADQRQQYRYGQSNFGSPDRLPRGYESSVMANINNKMNGGSTSRSGANVADDDGHSSNNNNDSFSGPALTRPQDAVMIVHDIASALVYLHSRGIIHRDIKPANILFSNGMAKLGDFGSAVKMNESRKLRNMKGTMSYMAPEMVLGEPYTEACDLWSFGCLIASIMGIHLGHLSGLHMPALNELYRSIPINGSLPLTCSNRLSSKYENHYTESTTIRVLAALRRALANEMAERQGTPPPSSLAAAIATTTAGTTADAAGVGVWPTHNSSTTSPAMSQASRSASSDLVDEAAHERRRAIAEVERADSKNRQRSVMCISTTSIDVLGEFPALLPASLVELFENLFHRDPSKRMTAADILDHPVSWDVEWMTHMMGEVQMIYSQLSQSTISARASMHANSRSRAAPATSSESSPFRGRVGSTPPMEAANSASGNVHPVGHYNSSYGSSAFASSSPNAAPQAAGYVSYFAMQSGNGGAGEMGGMSYVGGGEASVNVPCSANDYVLDLSLSGGEGGSGDEE
ncbi:putative protein kinase [Leptomonas pyrrhocoris]|uniref:non-specific serine/threonine protein kinase n=1 Tax=Leptomonas pyrrhocoris TaxID=157538 RepID=A0A0M9FSV8_LEPPY|nr:putative protein kinase [Leptomonas pyrrhocoris]KPA75297.1 putative protein kinase [Leptomonas pyrrhocoris]|eukprot:XP_015653736.1 putative protein kinase [Leptomonas pyrrhocoris]